MKRSSRIRIIKPAFLFLAVLVGVIGGPARARAEADPNQLLSFKRIYIEPSKDNVDGAFQAPVEQSYDRIFDRNPRFVRVDEPANADALLKTTLTKTPSAMEIEISLVIKSTEEIFSKDKLMIASASSGSEIGDGVRSLLKTVLKRIPFYGTVTGRDGTGLTFDIGEAHGLKRGDLIQISRIDNIKRHPLLKTIVDVQLVPVGTAAIDEVEESIAFGRVYNEIAGEKIQRMHKVTAIEGRLATERPRSTQPVADDGFHFDTAQGLPNESGMAPTPQGTASGPVADAAVEERPQLGWVGLGLFLGSFSSSSSRQSGLSNFSGSSFSPGVKLNGELWITKRWFADLAFGASTMSYRQTGSTTTSATEISSSTRSFGLNVGYKYLPTGSLYGPQAFVKLGYYSFTWDTSVIPAELLTSKSYSALNLGIGGLLPLTHAETTGVMLNVNLLLFPSLTEGSFKTGGSPSASGVNFFIGGYHHFSPKIALRAGFQFEVYSADFDSNTGTTSQKLVGFIPSLLYYF